MCTQEAAHRHASSREGGWSRVPCGPLCTDTYPQAGWLPSSMTHKNPTTSKSCVQGRSVHFIRTFQNILTHVLLVHGALTLLLTSWGHGVGFLTSRQQTGADELTWVSFGRKKPKCKTDRAPEPQAVLSGGHTRTSLSEGVTTQGPHPQDGGQAGPSELLVLGGARKTQAGDEGHHMKQLSYLWHVPLTGVSVCHDHAATCTRGPVSTPGQRASCLFTSPNSTGYKCGHRL